MKKYRFVYWFNSCITEWYVNANNLDEAKAKFKAIKGDKNIVNIEEDVE